MSAPSALRRRKAMTAPADSSVTPEMVEAACRAICAEYGWDADEPVTYSGTRTKARQRDASLIPQWQMHEKDVRIAIRAALTHQGRVVPVSVLEGLCEEWEKQGDRLGFPYGEDLNGCARGLRAIIEKEKV
jgi:hypothetical protein